MADLRRSTRLSREFLLLTVLASTIATLGLITDSAAVIIGAMLIAPLLSPIMAIALGALGGRSHLLLRASITLGAGVALSLAVSFAVAWLALRMPFNVLATIPLEVTSRTHPGPFDLAIALAGGAAASYALVRMKGAAALFGVAIATALVPPLCTVGIGLALGDAGIWMSSGTLFATNTVAIIASATIVFTQLRLRPRRSRAGHSGLALTGGLVVALGFVLVPSAVSLAQQSEAAATSAQFADSVSRTVADVLAARLPGSQLVDVQRTVVGSVLELRVTAEVAEAPSTAQVADIQADVATRLKRTVHLVVVGLPVVEIDAVSTAAPSAIPEPTATPEPTPTPTPEPTPTPTPAPTMHPPGPVDSTAWFTPYVPQAVAAIDAGRLLLVGGTAERNRGRGRDERRRRLPVAGRATRRIPARQRVGGRPLGVGCGALSGRGGRGMPARPHHERRLRDDLGNGERPRRRRRRPPRRAPRLGPIPVLERRRRNTVHHRGRRPHLVAGTGLVSGECASGGGTRRHVADRRLAGMCGRHFGPHRQGAAHHEGRRRHVDGVGGRGRRRRTGRRGSTAGRRSTPRHLDAAEGGWAGCGRIPTSTAQPTAARTGRPPRRPADRLAWSSSRPR